MSSTVDINVHHLTRVEGHGNIVLKASDGTVEKVEWQVPEAPRFFEAMVRGRSYEDIQTVVSRICGICSCSHSLTATKAVEDALGLEVSEQSDKLRVLLMHGEQIESHVLHFAFLHAPDFLGRASAFEIAEDNPQFVKDAIAMRTWGNKAIEIIGGRPVHPVGFRVGGLHRIIRKKELEVLLKDFDEVEKKAKRLLEFVLQLPIPEIEYDMTVMSLKGKEEYPIMEGVVANNLGGKFPEEEFEENVQVEQKKYSNALHYRLKNGKPYITGPLARFNLNYDLLAPEVRDVLEEAGYRAPLKNTFQSIIARAAETYHSVLEIRRLIEEYAEPSKPYIEAEIKPGDGAAIVEAPRGMLYHRYKIDGRGRITYANIIPPTTQNYAAMEEDIIKVEDLILKENYEKAKAIVETIIRNYDPCISCSVHAINLKIIRK